MKMREIKNQLRRLWVGVPTETSEISRLRRGAPLAAKIRDRIGQARRKESYELKFAVRKASLVKTAGIFALLLVFLALFSVKFDLQPWVKIFLADKVPAWETKLLSGDALAKRIASRIVPISGSQTSYGASFDQEGYETLLAWEKEIALSDEDYKGKLMALDFEVPCCGFKTMPEDYSQRCQCEHHLAMYGLAKKLITDGWGKNDVQKELDRWEAFFFPNETVAAALQKISPQSAPVQGDHGAPAVGGASVGGC